MNDTDLTLLRRWNERGEAEAFNELVRRHADMVFATCLRTLRNRADAEDVAQECFENLARGGVRVRSSLAGWLHALATHRSLNRIKHEVRRRQREKVFAEAPNNGLDADWAEVEALIDEALVELPLRLRTLVVAHFLERRTHEDIAQELGLPRRTVTHHINRAVEEIRAALRRRGVLVPAAALAAGLATLECGAAPAGLTASLGKLALRGPKTLAAASAGALALKWCVAGASALIAGVAALHVYSNVIAPKNQPLLAAKQPPAPLPTPPDTLADQPAAAPAPPSAEAPAWPSTDPLLIAEPSPCAAVTGRVVERLGKPIASAHVLIAALKREQQDSQSPLDEDMLDRGRIYEAVTDYTGRYTVQDICYAGPAMISAAAPGYAGDRIQLNLEAGKAQEAKDIELVPGVELNGMVVALDGRPVTDAIVSVLQAWNEQDYARGWGMVLTDERGCFRMGFNSEADLATFRVNSTTQGQHLFLDVSLRDSALRLQLQQKATLRGTLRWSDGKPADGLIVAVRGSLPYPDMATQYTGISPSIEQQTAVAADGTYALSGLYPGFRYWGRLRNPDDPPHHNPGLGPQFLKDVVFKPGEVREWSYTLSAPIVVHGHVYSERTKQPMKRIRVGLDPEGPPQEMPAYETQTDNEGAFTLRIGTGPGAYSLAPYFFGGPVSEDLRRDMPVRYGKQLHLAAGEEKEADLLLPEPVVLPLRVLDHAGRPVKSVNTIAHFVTPSGQTGGHGETKASDAEGRIQLLFFEPLSEVWVEVGADREGAKVESSHCAAQLGETLPEETLTLPPMCGLAGVVVDASGKLLPYFMISVYEEGFPESGINVATDNEGRFRIESGLRAGVLSLRIESAETAGHWDSGPIECAADTVGDLGSITLVPGPDTE